MRGQSVPSAILLAILTFSHYIKSQENMVNLTGKSPFVLNHGYHSISPYDIRFHRKNFAQFRHQLHSSRVHMLASDSGLAEKQTVSC